MNVYIVYHAINDGHNRLISVHSSAEAAERTVEKLQLVISSGSFYWTEELVQN